MSPCKLIHRDRIKINQIWYKFQEEKEQNSNTEYLDILANSHQPAAIACLQNSC